MPRLKATPAIAKYYPQDVYDLIRAFYMRSQKSHLTIDQLFGDFSRKTEQKLGLRRYGGTNPDRLREFIEKNLANKLQVLEYSDIVCIEIDQMLHSRERELKKLEIELCNKSEKKCRGNAESQGHNNCSADQSQLMPSAFTQVVTASMTETDCETLAIVHLLKLFRLRRSRRCPLGLLYEVVPHFSSREVVNFIGNEDKDLVRMFFEDRTYMFKVVDNEVFLLSGLLIEAFYVLYEDLERSGGTSVDAVYNKYMQSSRIHDNARIKMATNQRKFVTYLKYHRNYFKLAYGDTQVYPVNPVAKIDMYATALSTDESLPKMYQVHLPFRVDIDIQPVFDLPVPLLWTVEADGGQSVADVSVGGGSVYSDQADQLPPSTCSSSPIASETIWFDAADVGVPVRSNGNLGSAYPTDSLEDISCLLEAEIKSDSDEVLSKRSILSKFEVSLNKSDQPAELVAHHLNGGDVASINNEGSSVKAERPKKKKLAKKLAKIKQEELASVEVTATTITNPVEMTSSFVPFVVSLKPESNNDVIADSDVAPPPGLASGMTSSSRRSPDAPLIGEICGLCDQRRLDPPMQLDVACQTLSGRMVDMSVQTTTPNLQTTTSDRQTTTPNRQTTTIPVAVPPVQIERQSGKEIMKNLLGL